MFVCKFVYPLCSPKPFIRLRQNKLDFVCKLPLMVLQYVPCTHSNSFILYVSITAPGQARRTILCIRVYLGISWVYKWSVRV